MPRKYIRKKEQSYTIESLQKAVQEIKDQKITFRHAEEKYGIPRATLFDQVKKGSVSTIPKRGKKSVFNEIQENELVDFILKSCKAFFGITIPTLRKIAFDFATANNLKHNFNKETGMAGMDWYYNFLARHPNISLRRPEATSINRITAFNEEETDIFFVNLKALMIKYKFKSDSIYNIDETGISTVQRNSRILAPKGLKQVGKCTSAERGSLTTVVNCFNAGGSYVPPFFIFKRKRMNAQLMKDSNSNMVACVSDSGWINESIFVDWLQHFKEFAKPSADNPVLLVLDNHESHISLKAYEFCRKNFIHVLTLPPHTSHRMQPLDLTFHGPLKTAYNRECETYMVNHPGAKITAFDIVGLYTKAFNRCSSIDKAINGFKSAGIFPVDQVKFKGTFESFGDIITSETPCDTSHVGPDHDSQREFHSESQISDAANNSIPSEVRSQESQPSSNINIINESVPNVPDQDEINENNAISEADLNQSTTSQTSQSSSVPLSDLIKVPTLQINRSKRAVNKKHSIIFTSTPEKKNLEEKEQKKVDKKRKAQEKENKTTSNKLKKSKRSTGKGSKGVRNLNNFENEGNVDYFCIYCQEKYSDPPAEDWIMCSKCNKWAHENCTAGSSSKGFTCDFCV